MSVSRPRIMVLTLLVVMPFYLFSQNKYIAGRVTDLYGVPLEGVSISIVGTSGGVITDADGKFRLTARLQSSLIVSFTGFKSRSLKMDTLESGIQVRLHRDAARLEDVMVTGVATRVKRKNLANAVATISNKELIGVAPAQTLDAALEGKIPGAYINANTGAPGGGVSVKLRGVTSVYGNTQPLFVVDGVYVDNSATSAGLNVITGSLIGGSITSNANGGTQDNPSNRIADIRAEDIQSIEILKGASAAAVYGSRAAAGVIIITTKQGRAGRTNISFSQDFGFVKASKLLGVRHFTADRAAGLSADSAASAALRQQFLDAQAKGQIFDYEKEIFGNTGFTRNTAISVSGGTKKTVFYLSAAQKSDQGIVKNTGYRNGSFRLNLNHQFNDWFKLNVSANYINSSADRGLTGNDNKGATPGLALASTPDFAQIHADAFGNYPKNPFAASNPLQTVALITNNESVNRFITGVGLDISIQRGKRSQTRLAAQGGFDFYNLQTTAIFPAVLQSQAINKGTSILGSTDNLGINYILSVINTYHPAENLSFTSSTGFSGETGNYNNILNVATGLIAGQSNIDQAAALNAAQVRVKYANEGFYVQEEANIRDEFMITGGIRFDRSSNNGNEAKFEAYPKAGIAINLSKLIFPDAALFENIKLRAAFGHANNIPPYGTKFTSFSIANIGGYAGILIGSQEGNPDIKPERQSEFETGIDFGLLKGRLAFELTYYSKLIYGFLMQGALQPSSGFKTQWVNAGDLRNRGIELGMRAIVVETRSMNWNMSLNFWKNRSLVTKLSVPSAPFYSYTYGTFQIEQGKSATQLVGLDGRGGISRLGDSEPDFQMSSFNEIRFFNRLSLSFLINWKKGGQDVNITSLEKDLGGTSADYDKVTNHLGIPDGKYRVMQIGVDAHEFVQTSTYLRLREIGLDYRFTKFKINFVKQIQIGVSLNNFLTLTKYKSYDPEVSNFGLGFITNADINPYPMTKRAEFHFSINF